MFLLIEAVLSRIARRRPAEASGLPVSPSCISRSAELPRCRAGGGRPAARPPLSVAGKHLSYRAPIRRQETVSCFKSQAALERRLLRQRIPATGMNTECKYHHISRAASVEILDTQCHTLLDARAAQEGNTLLDAETTKQVPNSGQSLGVIPRHRGEFPCWTPGRHKKGIPLLNAETTKQVPKF